MTALVEVNGLTVRFLCPHSLGWRPPILVDALNEVSLTIAAGETVGLVGESGSGKSTLGRVLLGEQRPTLGSVRVGDWDVAAFAGRPPRAYRRRVQIVWQDPYSSLTPSRRIGDLLAEPIALHFELPDRAARERVAELLQLVGLDPSAAAKLPHEFSGGQRQRIAIARALSLEPSMIVLDEPVSALDVLTQAQILALLEEIRQRTGVTYFLISHNLGVVRRLCSRIVVLRNGRIVETGSSDDVCDRPQAKYTQELIASILEP